MLVSEYCSICDKKTLRKIDDCDCQKTAHNSDYLTALKVIEEYKRGTPGKVRSCLGVECFVRQRLNQSND